MRKMDITDMDFPGESFDVIICYHVLEHIKDDLKAMSELSRVLKKSGYAILQVPVKEIDETIEYSKPDPKESYHVRMYGRDYKDRLESAGFEVLVDDYLKNINAETLRKYGMDAEDIYFCRIK
jgi:ubiquinone/menaquinone biosynthesis C-methylase UbiE